ncbi:MULTISPECIES: toll/interleukin-1 receptor domain-containing protein [unclassified Modicisalibacter]|uniref:toll/interleukin-1 receptor domain-containing protein n=1 Tax=unclassified Modicisalibacter TaxID=2679913 RepID=UPI001CCF8BED|nr:toll/interleukin-1 receptor domain-containing protein [Modicisalibacter sp. R2A 31.J]MBZ9577155.1 toll/interleukin-1 receptor domain-containing protein [Modicisalibacter sp. MOD 31.J]
MSPKVFISHASEDKPRFVSAFATRLRENGVDAWLDRWEMLPGDSLVDKIFEEGLKEAQAVIIVLSNFSVSKPWVSEELNASIVARISKGTKIIPVVIDDCDVPEALKSTLWERVVDPSDFDEPLRRILAAIFDVREKPEVGEPPEFVREATSSIEGLSSVDELVLKRTAKYDLENNSHIVEPENIFSDLNTLGLSKQQILDSIEVLDTDGFFEVSRYVDGGPDRYGCYIQVTPFGLQKYCSTELDTYEQLKDQCAGLIVNEGVQDNQSLAKRTGAHLRLIEHILDVFESNGLIETSKYLGGNITIHSVHAKFRRMLT